MKKKHIYFFRIVDIAMIIAISALIVSLFIFDLDTMHEREEISSHKVIDQIYTAQASVIDLETGLSIQPKEAVMYYELTEEDIAEIEYYDSLELLAICVEAEAGNQDLLGKQLVVDVILNRVDSDDFPNNITDVITQPYQFTSYTDGNMNKVWEPSEETFQAVRMELENRTDDEILFFTEGKYNPYCTPAYKHGAHYFGY